MLNIKVVGLNVFKKSLNYILTDLLTDKVLLRGTPLLKVIIIYI